jgi:hypothetical protein
LLPSLVYLFFYRKDVNHLYWNIYMIVNNISQFLLNKTNGQMWSTEVKRCKYFGTERVFNKQKVSSTNTELRWSAGFVAFTMSIKYGTFQKCQVPWNHLRSIRVLGPSITHELHQKLTSQVTPPALLHKHRN